MSTNKRKTTTLRRKTKSFLVGLSTIAILLGIFIFGHSLIYAQKILPHTAIGNVEVGGLSKAVAAKRLNQNLATITSVKYYSQDKLWDFKISDLGIIFDPETSIKEAYSLGKSGGVSSKIKDQFVSLFSAKKYPLHFVIDESKLLAVFDQLVAKDIEDSELETSLIVENGQPKIIPGKEGQRIDRTSLIRTTKFFLKFPYQNSKLVIEIKKSQPLVTVDKAQKAANEAKLMVANGLKLKTTDKEFNIDTNFLSSWITGKVMEETSPNVSERKSYLLTAAISQDKVEAYVKALAGEVNQDPANAKISMSDGQIKILEGSVTGLTLQEKETMAEIVKKLEARKLGEGNLEVALVVEVTDPEINSEMINNLGIKELIGKAATDFSGSPTNRITNITIGANLLSSAIVKNGDEFSALKLLGKVDASQGFLPELVIHNNKLEKQFGGGLCQNATTLFRAILDAGLPITSRQNHSRRVSYYEKPITTSGINLTFDAKYANIGNSLVGYDATVFVPQPDLKFKNNTGNAVLVQQFVTGKTIYSEIYGTKDNRLPLITKAEILSTKPMSETIYHDAPDLPKGTNEQTIKGVAGAKTKFSYTIKYADGKEESQDFISYYNAITPEIKVGSQEIIQPAPIQ